MAPAPLLRYTHLRTWTGLLAAVTLVIVAMGVSPMASLASEPRKNAETVADGRPIGPRVHARPDTPGSSDDAWTTSPDTWRSFDTPHFRLHWTTESEDAAETQFVKQAGQVLEHVWQRQINEMGWPAPLEDGNRGGSPLLDVYFTNLETAYGYVSPDDVPCRTCKGTSGFLVLDNDYVGFEPSPNGALRSTAAHEFHHLVQFAETWHVEAWAYEATAVWMERIIYPEIDSRSMYLYDFADYYTLSFTDFDDDGGFDRSYGLYIWNVWLEERYGPDVVYDAWRHAANTGEPIFHGYEAALEQRGETLTGELVAFTTATTVWEEGGFPPGEGPYPEIDVEDRLSSGETTSVRLDHISAALYDLDLSGSTTVIVRAPKFVAGGVGVGVVRNGNVESLVDATLVDGEARIDVTGVHGDRDEKVVLVIVNTDESLGAVPPPLSDQPTYLNDDVEYLVGINVDPGRPEK